MVSVQSEDEDILTLVQDPSYIVMGYTQLQAMLGLIVKAKTVGDIELTYVSISSEAKCCS